MIKIFDIDSRNEITNLPEHLQNALEKIFSKFTENWIDVFGTKDGHHFCIYEAYIEGCSFNNDDIQRVVDSLDLECINVDC